MIEHDVSVYDNDPYEKENLLSMSNYVNLIDKYSIDKSSFLFAQNAVEFFAFSGIIHRCK